MIRSLPQGYESQLSKQFGGHELSEGQWQRLAVARGIMQERPLLIVFDEPTSAIDPETEAAMYDMFIQRARSAAEQVGAVTVLVSHRLSTVRAVDRIVFLDCGEVVETGSHDELLDLDGQYARLYNLQASGYS